MWFALLAVVGSLAYLPSIADPRNGKEVIFLALMLAAAPFALTTNNWLRALAGLMVGSLCLHPSLPGLNEVVLVICALVLLKHCQQTKADDLVTLLVWSGVALCGLIVVQALGLGPANYVTTNPNRPYSGFTQSTADTAAMLAIVAPVALFKKRYGLFVVIVAGMLAMKSVAATVALVTGVGVVYAWRFYQKQLQQKHGKDWLMVYAVLVSFFALIVAGAMAKDPKSEVATALSDDRWKVWWTAIHEVIVSKQWFLGRGIGSFVSTFGGLAEGVDANGVLQVKWFAEAHNEYVQVFYELGIVGFAFAVGAVFSILRAAWKKDDAVFAGLLSGCVVALGHFTFHIVLCTVPMVLLVALALKTREDDEPYDWDAIRWR